MLAPANAPGSSIRRLTKPSTGEMMFVFESVILSSSSRAVVCCHLRLGDAHLRHRRVVARLGVFEHLLGHQPALVARLAAAEHVGRDLLVALAVDDRRLVHVEVRLRLADLLQELAVFDLGDLLALGDAVAELHGDRLEPARHARLDVHRRLADEVADGRDVVDDVLTRGRRRVHRHHATAAAAAALPPGRRHRRPGAPGGVDAAAVPL